MAYVPVVVLAALALLSAVVLTRMLWADGRGPAPPPRSHTGDGPPRAWWTDRQRPAADEDPDDGPRVLLVDEGPVRRRA